MEPNKNDILFVAFIVLLIFLIGSAMGCANLKKAFEPGPAPAMECFKQPLTNDFICYSNKGEK